MVPEAPVAGFGYTRPAPTAPARMSNQDADPTTTQLTLLSSGPRRGAPRSACVVVIHGDGLGKRADIHDHPVVIGRSQEADLHIPHKSVSRRHCEIRRVGDEYRLRDLGATNPTRLNDQVVVEAVLGDGDHITVGETILKFISHSSVEALYHEEVYQLATHDPLTELCNRRHFAELADKEIARALRHGRPLVLCIVDVDLFKPVNDRFGHIAGDGVLRQIAAILRGLVRGEDIAARIGGEEFAVLLPETGLEAARRFAERLRKAVEAETFLLGNEPHRLTVSVGIARLSPERGDRSRLMQAADAALYRAKDEGRNRVRVEP
ncbi:GGDEF domain-containing protein [Arenimonas fontis]|uniref:diguanylate cyclase n=2 Tax=Arenimonas fontis TaxID=2608255 RepID=A0A5B2ZBR4_9GAMM|nr:GGDEF domain-containing protein [Arenimonas fontis]